MLLLRADFKKKNLYLFLDKHKFRANSLIGSKQSLDQFRIVGTYNLLYNASLMVEAGLGSALSIDGILETKQTNLRFYPAISCFNSQN